MRLKLEGTLKMLVTRLLRDMRPMLSKHQEQQHDQDLAIGADRIKLKGPLSAHSIEPDRPNAIRVEPMPISGKNTKLTGQIL